MSREWYDRDLLFDIISVITMPEYVISNGTNTKFKKISNGIGCAVYAGITQYSHELEVIFTYDDLRKQKKQKAHLRAISKEEYERERTCI